ncbi:Gldg family protein [Pseudohongiella sp. SYSU M77423]|uniref:Gldg family protein n=1 Tax=unclassified Pseudohongiella TaxID=2629611 RepID=UPI001F1B0E77|nr:MULTISPECIES: Gldg family protein [unclassified Pseudohongiella]MDH7942680.1 Gldg family protein [Pseudohongiella sp. SYSU M77423]
MKNKALYSPAGLATVAVGLIIVITLISLLPRLRLDLTQQNLYTLSDATRDIVSDLDRPLELTFFYSEEAASEVPQVRTYAQRVQEMLREIVIASDGMLSLEMIDPEPFSAEEDLATAYGIQSVPLAQGRESVYFGVVASDPSTAEDGEPGVYETIPLIRPDQEEFLEYEFARLITRVIDPDPTVVGLITSLDIDGGFNPATNQASRAWAVMDTVRYMYDVERLQLDVEEIGENIDILMIVHPQDLPEQTLYAIDQFVLRGGRAIVFVDPNSDTQTQIAMSGGGFRDTMASDLPGLLEAWGVDYNPEQVVTDSELALYVTLQAGQRPVAHYGMLGIQREGFADDIVSGQLEVMNMSSTGSLSPIESASTTFDPLIQTSEQTMLMAPGFFSEMGDPTLLIDEFESENRRHTLAARVSGPAQTAFPQGVPVEPEPAPVTIGAPATEASDDPLSAAEETEEPAEAEVTYRMPDNHLSESDGDIAVIVVADSDVLADRMWAQSQQIAGQRVINAFASNGDFMINALDNLSGSTELVNIRSRGRYARPFTRVLDLQREADERLRAEETRLLERLSQTEQQLMALNQEGSTGISPEQEAQIEQFLQLQLETRRELRDVQFRLNQEIDRLGTVLQIINTWLIPALLIIVVLTVSLLKSRRRRRFAHAR